MSILRNLVGAIFNTEDYQLEYFRNTPPETYSTDELQELVDVRGVDPNSRQWCEIFKRNGWDFSRSRERASAEAYEYGVAYADEPASQEQAQDANIRYKQDWYNAARTWELLHKHENRINETVDAEWSYADGLLTDGEDNPQLPSGETNPQIDATETYLLEAISRAIEELRWDDYNELVKEYCR